MQAYNICQSESSNNVKERLHEKLTASGLLSSTQIINTDKKPSVVKLRFSSSANLHALVTSLKQVVETELDEACFILSSIYFLFSE